MKFGKSILGDYKQGTEREYLITNGKGSFSGGSINGNLPRKYSGALLASFLPPLDRYMTFHKVEEELNERILATGKEINGNKEKITDGYKYLDSFELSPFPKWVYSVDGTFLEKEIFMPFEKDTVIFKYKILLSSKETNKLKLNLFFNYRGFDNISKMSEEFIYDTVKTDKGLEIKLGEKTFYVYSNGNLNVCDIDEEIEEDFYGNRINERVKQNIAYDIDLGERGDSSLDSSVKSAFVEVELKEGEELYVVGSMEEINKIDVSKLYNKELKRVKKLKESVGKDEFQQDLAYAADTFVVYRQGTDGKTILAGYPWFGDWGRDTMIALPGLTLATGRYDDAKSILQTFAKYCDKGMLPNKFPDWKEEKLRYNTIDASLWYFYAVYKYVEYTGDYDFVKDEIYPVLESIIKYHIKGTRYNIKVDTDGLLKGGDENTQLTWMDVKYKGWAVTPRYGKAVEINALWYNALKTMSELAEKFHLKKELFDEYAEKVESSFVEKFWIKDKGYLNDYIAEETCYLNNHILGEEKFDDIRPNQIFAVSLPYSMLNAEMSKKVVDIVLEKLYTPHGLRSISIDNLKYIGKYYGSLYERDRAYHQGTVWSWPMGHFITAFQKVYNNGEKAKLLLEGLKSHFYQEGCINNISEIFEGDYPVGARGCYAQAWSVGELLRVLKEDI